MARRLNYTSSTVLPPSPIRQTTHHWREISETSGRPSVLRPATPWHLELALHYNPVGGIHPTYIWSSIYMNVLHICKTLLFQEYKPLASSESPRLKNYPTAHSPASPKRDNPALAPVKNQEKGFPLISAPWTRTINFCSFYRQKFQISNKVIFECMVTTILT